MSRPKKYAKRANIDCFSLAKEIEVRPIIWDVRHVSHHNRVALNESWNEIGNILNQPGSCLLVFVCAVFMSMSFLFCRGHVSQKMEILKGSVQERTEVGTKGGPQI